MKKYYLPTTCIEFSTGTSIRMLLMKRNRVIIDEGVRFVVLCFSFYLQYSVFGTVLTLRRLMSYIYMEHPFLMFLDHTQRRNTVGRTPLDE